MIARPPLIERAYEVAGSGGVANISHLVRTLTREGYEVVEAHVQSGTQLRRDLDRLCRKAWVEAGNEPLPPGARAPRSEHLSRSRPWPSPAGLCSNKPRTAPPAPSASKTS